MQSDPPSITFLFAPAATFQSWLDIEALLATTQGEMGIIPEVAATEIAAHCDIRQYDLQTLENSVAQTMSPVMSVVQALSERCSADAGKYVHWGATTQNVVAAGKLLQLRLSHHHLLRRMAASLARLADLAEETHDWPAIGRTNGRRALPISFGYRVATWIEELQGCVERLQSAASRGFVLVFGGAVGPMHTWGAPGFDLVERMAKVLGVRTTRVNSRVSVSGFVEYVCCLAQYGAVCERIGRVMFSLMFDELGEISEHQGSGVVGSSTMPQKSNPKYMVNFTIAAAALRQMAGRALDAGQQTFEGDAEHSWRLYRVIDEAAGQAYDLAALMEQALARLERKRPVNSS